MGRGASKAGSGGGKLYSNEAFNENGEDWDEFENSFGPKLSMTDAVSLGNYVGTSQSFKLNEKLYTNKEDSLTDKERNTMETLDRVISTHKTPRDGVFTRYVGSNAIQDTLGLSNAQMADLLDAGSMDSKELALLNKALKGTISKSASYTSTSATKEHMFSGWHSFRREISIPKGTPAFACNRKEHETIFGRNMKTVLDHVGYDKQSHHVVLYERFIGYEE